MGEMEMIKTDIHKEVKKLCIEESKSLTSLAEEIGSSKQYISQLLGKNTLVNPMLVKLVEALGYDVEVTFVKRGEE